MTPSDTTPAVSEEQVIQRIAEIARAVGFQAGVEAMDTAGIIVSFLAANPSYIADFMSGEGSIMDWPAAWHSSGCLTWQGMDGKIHWPGEKEVKQWGAALVQSSQIAGEIMGRRPMTRRVALMSTTSPLTQRPPVYQKHREKLT